MNDMHSYPYARMNSEKMKISKDMNSYFSIHKCQYFILTPSLFLSLSLSLSLSPSLSLSIYTYIYLYMYREREREREICGVMDTTAENEHGDAISKPGRVCLHFTQR